MGELPAQGTVYIHLCRYLFKIYFINYAITVVPIFPLCPAPPSTSIPSTNSLSLSSCPWVMHISSLASPFPTLYLTYPCLFCTYQFVLLIPCTFSLFSPLPLPTDNPPNHLHIYDSVSVLLVCFVLFLDSIVDSCEFIVILMFIVLILFFFLNMSL